MASFSSFQPFGNELESYSPGATVTRVRSDITFLAVTAALHLVIGGSHQNTHVVAEVKTLAAGSVHPDSRNDRAMGLDLSHLEKKPQDRCSAFFSVDDSISCFRLGLHFGFESLDI